MQQLSVRIDPTEVAEAFGVLAQAASARAQLPGYLRTELDETAARPALFVAAAADGGEVALVLTPRGRSLVANLRAQMTIAAEGNQGGPASCRSLFGPRGG